MLSRVIQGLSEAPLGPCGLFCKKRSKVNDDGGPKSKLSLEERLLLALDYWREYCAFFHVAGNFGVSESTTIGTTHWVEETLMESGQFTLPKRQEWQGDGTDIEGVLIDAMEVEIERPKKSKKRHYSGKKNKGAGGCEQRLSAHSGNRF